MKSLGEMTIGIKSEDHDDLLQMGKLIVYDGFSSFQLFTFFFCAAVEKRGKAFVSPRCINTEPAGSCATLDCSSDSFYIKHSYDRVSVPTRAIVRE